MSTRPRVYVAGGSSERLTVVRPIVDRLIDAGVTITHDWTRCEGYENPDYDNSKAAANDLRGCRMADLVWVMVPEQRSEGQAVELGYSLALGIPLIISGPHVGRSVFHSLVRTQCETHEQAFKVILGL